MFCSKCGNKMEDGAKFCNSCGSALVAEQLETNASATVSRKINKKLPVIITVCIVFIMVAVISVFAFNKKIDKVTQIVNAYENTINADSFNIHVIMNDNFRYVYEVFGKGGLENTYIARYDIRGDFNNVKSNYEDYLDEFAHGDKTGGYEYELLAERDFAGLWNYELGEEIGLTYDDAYTIAVDMASDYLKNKSDNSNVDIDIEDNSYSISIDFDELEQIVESSGHYDKVEEFLEGAKETKYDGFRFEVTLEGEYIKSIYVYFTADTVDNPDYEKVVIGIEFDSVNELTKETSLAYKKYNELNEEVETGDEINEISYINPNEDDREVFSGTEDGEEILHIDVEEEVNTIRAWYYSTQDNLDNLLKADYPDNIVCYFDGAYPSKVVVPKDYDDWEYSREYFYHDKQLYFAFVYNKSEEYRFYFQNGVLIRYIDTDGNIFDYGDLDDYSMEKRVKNESDSLFPTMINCGD